MYVGDVLALACTFFCYVFLFFVKDNCDVRILSKETHRPGWWYGEYKGKVKMKLLIISILIMRFRPDCFLLIMCRSIDFLHVNC